MTDIKEDDRYYCIADKKLTAIVLKIKKDYEIDQFDETEDWVYYKTNIQVDNYLKKLPKSKFLACWVKNKNLETDIEHRTAVNNHIQIALLRAINSQQKPDDKVTAVFASIGTGDIPHLKIIY